MGIAITIRKLKDLVPMRLSNFPFKKNPEQTYQVLL